MTSRPPYDDLLREFRRQGYYVAVAEGYCAQRNATFRAFSFGPDPKWADFDARNAVLEQSCPVSGQRFNPADVTIAYRSGPARDAQG